MKSIGILYHQYKTKKMTNYNEIKTNMKYKKMLINVRTPLFCYPSIYSNFLIIALEDLYNEQLFVIANYKSSL